MKHKSKKKISNSVKAIFFIAVIVRIWNSIKNYWKNSTKTQKTRIVIWWIVYLFIVIPLLDYNINIGAFFGFILIVWGMYNLRKRSKEQNPEKFSGSFTEDWKEGLRKQGKSESEIKTSMKWGYFGLAILILGAIGAVFFGG